MADRLPLYKNAPDWPWNDPAGNAGLRYDKFFGGWDDGFRKVREPDAKTGKVGGNQDWVHRAAQKSVGEQTLLGEHADRARHLAAALGGRCLEGKTEWRFVSGLGIAHPVENGFAWHHSLGVPYLPGSGVKGVVRDWIYQWADEADEAFKKKAARVLGTRRQVGTVSFLDALPTEPVMLVADGMTPHHSKYYSEGKPPGDWEDPKPIPFLSVAPHQSFLFVVLPRLANDEAGKGDAKTAVCWLKEMLGQIGGGAKSNVGYGRFGSWKER